MLRILPFPLLIALLPVVASAEPVKELPLKRGFYVTSDTPCARASNATLSLVARTGINSARTECIISTITQTGPTTFDVTDTCTDITTNDSFGETTTAYDIPDSETYRFVIDGGFTGESRYCAQSDMPEPWSQNDISDITD